MAPATVSPSIRCRSPQYRRIMPPGSTAKAIWANSIERCRPPANGTWQVWLRAARLLSAIVLVVLVQASVRAANSIQQTDIRPQGYGMHATGGATQCHFADE